MQVLAFCTSTGPSILFYSKILSFHPLDMLPIDFIRLSFNRADGDPTHDVALEDQKQQDDR